MTTELRAIWSEDQYQILGASSESGGYYFGRQKGDQYQVFLRFANSTKRRWIQTVHLDQDWYWCERNQNLVTEEPQEEPSLVERSENVLSGYVYGNDLVKKSLPDLSQTIRVKEQILETGAEVIWLIPEHPKSWMLSLHGGPESYEGQEIRYGGLYRKLLQEGHAIAVLNYRGSTQLDAKVSQQAWRKWKESILADFSAVRGEATKLHLAEMPHSVFGVSFGGALALVLHNEFGFSRVVLSSPLLDLTNQERRASSDFADWFQSRFDERDRYDFSFQELCKSSAGQVHVFYSLEDEVLGGDLFTRLEREKAGHLSWSLYRQTGGHAPSSYLEMKLRFGRIAEIINYR